ncbi:hypothetical protein EXU85_07505 [Spirosoma sp. KCTC 42546]|uniref:hypothetical protein n=1 Tax=Spirosoma sp. KCTC 42546 TaxID=2520506 RepID=UPI00115813E2|nr:hypothetical protein [Spirosoma sp. KCTC 42546]QDK78460.1 hypothetical protein EXU85_07505 [Spirosoma sp. KCTC 42546]
MTHIFFSKYPHWSRVFFVALLWAPTLLTAQIRNSTPLPLPKPSLRVGADGLMTIENSQIKVGINTNAGGAITYLTFQNDQGGKVNTRNMVSNPLIGGRTDLGRQIQIGLYGGPYEYSQNGNPAWVGLGWNPIQAGDVYFNSAQVLLAEKQDNLLHTKTIPKQFAFYNEPGEATIEHWIRLDGNVVKVHVKVVLSRSDKTQYEARQQEFPCMYLTGDYHNMWLYKGSSPYTNGSLALERIQPPQTTIFGDVFPTEPWMASTNDNGYGVGLYAKGNYEWKRGYFGADLGGDETSTVASYIAAANKVVFDHNLVHEWDYELILGHLSEIRSYVYNKQHSPPGPNYLFDTSRKGWLYYHATDTGWPISGKLHVHLDDATNARILSPFVFWKGRSNPKIYLRAAFNTQSDKFRIKWRRSDDITIYGTGDRIMEFPVINDGQFHTYTIDLSSNDYWLEADIGQIAFEPVTDKPQPNAWVEFAWVATSPDGPTPEIVDPFVPPVDNPCVPGCALVSVKKIQYIKSNRKR